MSRASIALLLGLLLASCGGRTLALVQTNHGHEFRCDRRYVRVERVRAQEWVSRGCGFEADWTCEGGTCVLRDSRAHGMGGP